MSILLKTISHPLRLSILCVLSLGERHVQEIVDFVGTSQSNVSQHLLRLKERGVLSVHKKANRVYYSIEDERMLALLQQMRRIFCKDIKESVQ